MKATIGLILVLVGGAVVLFGIGGAVVELFGLYRGAMDDAMGMAAGAERETSRAMIRSVIIGACGVPLLIAGGVVLKVSLFQRMARRGASQRK